MVLYATFTNFLFASCDKEEDVPQYVLFTDNKELTKIVTTLSDPSINFLEILDFNYDNEGKLIEATFTNSGKNQIKTTYTWSNNEISAPKETDYGSEYIQKYKLKNGLIQDSDLKYNDSGHPKEYMGISYMWDNDKLIRASQEAYTTEHKVIISSNYYYDESSKVCNGYNPLVVKFVTNEEYLLFAHPELMGIRTTQLPIRYIYTDGYIGGSNDMIQRTFSYKFDNDGYITEIREKSQGHWVETIYTLTWE